MTIGRNIDIKNNNIQPYLKKKSESVFFALDKNKSTLFSKGKRIDNFFTEDSKLYITPREMRLLEKGVKLERRLKRWDNISSKIVSEYKRQNIKKNDFLFNEFKEKYEYLHEEIVSMPGNIFNRFSVVRLWNISIVASILFGMFSMTMVYRYLGQGVSANELSIKSLGENQSSIERVAGTSDSRLEEEGDLYTKYFIEEAINDEKSDLESEIGELVKGYPIEEMVPYIAEKDRIVAAFIIGIAKKESNWGKRVPLLNGQDCYNYWGYRGIRKLMGTGGHTCFNSRKDAIDTVAKRIETLVNKYELDTPAKMVIWKCGSNCAVTGGQAAADKWISDVNMYFKKLNIEQ